jgi:hypothetical protein
MKQYHVLFAICLLALHLASGVLYGQPAREKADVYTEFNYGQERGGENWIQSILVTKPAYRSEVRGLFAVNFKAPGMTAAKAMCWQQPTPEKPDAWGHDENLTPRGIFIATGGTGGFVINVDKFPHGPMNIRIFASNAQGEQDICELQLFNSGGVKWNQGIPAKAPPADEKLQLIFADDFDKPLSVSNDGRGTTYNAHKPRFGESCHHDKMASFRSGSLVAPARFKFFRGLRKRTTRNVVTLY